jgi:SAM-dependent methyltransferase
MLQIRDAFYYAAGIAFLAMAKLKHTLRGYTSPKPFDSTETQRCIDYDQRVVDEWLQALAAYRDGDRSIAGRNVLELGPGSDLGVGLLLLAGGAARYNACDVNNLVARTPPAFYESFIEYLASRVSADKVAELRAELERQRSGAESLLNYVVTPDFNLVTGVGRGTIDLVFSQAAFEHFDDIDAVVAQLTEVCKPGAMIVAEIDLKTHSRWIRDKDPNNIYRYSDAVYRSFWFRGIPNRVRPHEYRNAFARHGWNDIRIHALAQTSADGKWSRQFTDSINEMQYLSIVLCATRGARSAGLATAETGPVMSKLAQVSPP